MIAGLARFGALALQALTSAHAPRDIPFDGHHEFVIIDGLSQRQVNIDEFVHAVARFLLAGSAPLQSPVRHRRHDDRQRIATAKRFVLQRVGYMPKELQAGVLYVSEEFLTAAHLCACGCGATIRTPLGPTEWSVEQGPQGPTLWPSVGNWQQGCRSHYWFRNGEVVWGEAWSPAQIAAGRAHEEVRRRAHYDALDRKRVGTLRKFWRWLKNLFER